MLGAQHKDFDEKGSSNYPRDFSRWYQLDYFHRPRGLKSRRFYLTLGVTLATTLLCLASVLSARLHHVHEAAPVSKAHAGFNMQCANCHDQAWQPLMRLCSGSEMASVSDTTCRSCHDGPIHQASQSSEPACASCHREHQGKQLLAQVANRQCASCHANLDQHSAKVPNFDTKITDFNVDHPPFKPSSDGKQDEAQVRFTHVVHMNLDLAVLRKSDSRLGVKYGTKLKLECADCHQADSQRRYMKPIKYDDHCATCHQLTATIVGDFADVGVKQAAADFRREPAPHQEPERVRAVLRDRFVQFAQSHKVVPADAKPPMRPLPWQRPADISEGVWNWASGQTQKNEALLFANQQMKIANDQQFAQCSHCHIEAKEVPKRSDGLPTYAATKIPSRWYTHSVFNHGSHRMMSCEECHDKARTSQTTADILVPKMQLCQKCHQQGGLARSDCVECHQYHDRKLERGVERPFNIEELLKKR
jgi:hypothetical protein